MPKPKAKIRTDHEHALTGEKLTLLAVFAHPEDEAFGPVGTLAKYASEGVRVLTVTASREPAFSSGIAPVEISGKMQIPLREKLCSCLTYGTERICLLDRSASKLHIADETAMEERLVRLIREQQPQVMVTYGPAGITGDPEHMLISRLATCAFHAAGDPVRFPQHVRDGLYPFQPKKLYYSVLPHSFLNRWGLRGLAGVPDDQVTTVLDVSLYSEAKLRTLYCQRNHMLDYARWLSDDTKVQWDEEYFALAASNLRRRSRAENDLFAGLR
jgi:LmbE family N-acetylglucosaminyl deacetylase